jgi:hypothetical protein
MMIVRDSIRKRMNLWSIVSFGFGLFDGINAAGMEGMAS